MCKFFEFFFNLDQSHSLNFCISMPLKLVCLYNGYSVPLAGFTTLLGDTHTQNNNINNENTKRCAMWSNAMHNAK